MSLKLALLLALLAASAGIGFGYLLRLIISLGRRGSMELDIKQMEIDAREEAQSIVSEAEIRSEEILNKVRGELSERENRVKKAEDRLVKREEFLDKRQIDLDKENETIKEKTMEVKVLADHSEELVRTREAELAKLSGLTPIEAREELLKTVEKEAQEDILIRLEKFKNYGEEKIEARAREILATTIQRLSTSVSNEIMATIVSLESDEIKGKIIGKEGRNIKAFERVTGVEVIVDDTPGSITLSSYDPIRRAVAKMALENLIADGRIQPAKIEEFVKKADSEVSKIIKEKGEQAAYECEAYNLDPKLLSILGRLHFRTSYGQNVLAHSIEMSHLAGMIAEELGANVSVAKTGALLHDIGKALDHEVSGTHVEIGKKILEKFNVPEDVIKAMQAHHGDYPYETIESIIVQTADAISGSRPGARRDALENYLKRLQDLELLALSFDGVEKAYALQAGREIRVFVMPDKISDLDAQKMARDIAIRIENELKYPGEIKISVIRENRVIDYAR
jgi:ribonucrease Y